MSNTAEKNTKKKSISSPSDSMSYSPIQIDKKPAYIPTKVSTDRIMGDIERYQQMNFSMKKKKPEEEQIIFTHDNSKKRDIKSPNKFNLSSNDFDIDQFDPTEEVYNNGNNNYINNSNRVLVGENFFANTVKRESNLKADLLQSSRNLESHSACSNKYYDENRLTSSSAVRFSGNAVNHFFKENDFQQKTEKTKFSPLNKKEENDNDTYMNLKKSFEQILVKIIEENRKRIYTPNGKIK